MKKIEKEEEPGKIHSIVQSVQGLFVLRKKDEAECTSVNKTLSRLFCTSQPSFSCPHGRSSKLAFCLSSGKGKHPCYFAGRRSNLTSSSSSQILLLPSFSPSTVQCSIHSLKKLEYSWKLSTLSSSQPDPRQLGRNFAPPTLMRCRCRHRDHDIGADVRRSFPSYDLRRRRFFLCAFSCPGGGGGGGGAPSSPFPPPPCHFPS